MDRFGVPNKVNRHVNKALKAIYQRKGSSDEESATFSEIFSEVKKTMRNLRPVRNLKGYVKKSLKNMGVVRRNGAKPIYTLGRKSSKPSRTMFPNVVSLEHQRQYNNKDTCYYRISRTKL